MPYLRTISRGAEVSCGNCRAVHAVDRNEDGSAECENSRCTHDECTKRMCSECVCECDGCKLPFCRAHVTDYSGYFYCGLCMEENGHEESLEPQGSEDQRRTLVNA